VPHNVGNWPPGTTEEYTSLMPNEQSDRCRRDGHSKEPPTYRENVYKKSSRDCGLAECLNHFLRDGDVLIFVALDIDAVDHFDGGSPEVCSDHVGKDVLVVLGAEEVYDKITSRSKLHGLIGDCGTRMHVGVKEPSALLPLSSIW
jgi:hypothetical protein